MTGSEEETEASGPQSLLENIRHIITCLYRLSTILRNHGPPPGKFAETAAIDMSHFKPWDIECIRKKFPQAPEYLVTRLGEANNKRRQLLLYCKHNYDKGARYIDLPLPASDTGVEADTIASSNSPAIVPTVPQSEATAIRLDDIVLEELDSDDDLLSETVYTTSTNKRINIQVLPPPNLEAAFHGEPLQCPYCNQIMKVDILHSWR